MRPKATSPESAVPVAAEHIDYLERLVYTNVHGSGFNDPGAAPADAGGNPAGAAGAWEYWGNGSYYETGPDGSYTGGYWASEG
jgi:hypothetical protein